MSTREFDAATVPDCGSCGDERGSPWDALLVAGAGGDALEGTSPTYDSLVDSAPDLDIFCSSSDWVVPAHRAFGAGDAWVVFDQDDAPAAAVALAGAVGRGGARVLCGLDPVWGYARPVVGPDPTTCASFLLETLAADAPRWDVAVLTGITAGSAFAVALAARLPPRWGAQARPATTRQVVELDDGVEGFLVRRSPRFRKNVRQAQRRAAKAGIELCFVEGGGPEIVARCCEVEARSWKGQHGSGLAEPAFASFYRHIAGRLAPSQRLRAGFAVLGGRDVAFILGAVRNGWYRGLQLGYDSALAGLSLGNLLQIAQMERLCAEGIRHYDLGMDMAYKRSWADRAVVNETVVVWARP